jgi:hypothetical protein
VLAWQVLCCPSLYPSSRPAQLLEVAGWFRQYSHFAVFCVCYSDTGDLLLYGPMVQFSLHSGRDGNALA